jgi:hypothetical protein
MVDREGALQVALKVLTKTMDSTTLSADKREYNRAVIFNHRKLYLFTHTNIARFLSHCKTVDFATLTVDEKTGKVTFTQLKAPKLEEIVKIYNDNKPENDDD